MKKLLLIFISITLVAISGNGQKKDSLVTGWNLRSTLGANGTQSTFINWSAGGRNNISVLGFINAIGIYKSEKAVWNNTLSVALGGLQYIGTGAGKETLQKTDDRIELGTIYGLKFKNKWYVSTMASFRTQLLDGYNYPNDSVKVSRFMAPGYLMYGLGIEYQPSDHFSAYFYPVSAKFTFVNDRTLSNAGSFGVRPAEYDLTTGELIREGERYRAEFGAQLRAKYSGDLAENINLVASLDLFSNYLDRPENIDVNSDVMFTFKINGWLSTSLNWTLFYDNDIEIMDYKGDVGPRTQFKSVLGLGISYKLTNKKK